MRGNKGITLVALIITIIVMLILVGVSVEIVINTDLFGIAEKTGKDYKAATEKEANMNRVMIGNKEYESIDDYLKDIPITTTETTTENTITLKDSLKDHLYNYKIYGNADGVGDLVENGEYAGKYKIPVTVSGGKNLFDISEVVPGSCVKVEVNGIKILKQEEMVFYTCYEVPNLKPNTSHTVSCDVEGEFTGRVYGFLGDSLSSTYVKDGKYVKTVTTDGDGNLGIYGNDKDNIRIYQNNPNTGVNLVITNDNITISNIQIEEGSTATYYEPYEEPITTNIYLDEPLTSGQCIEFAKGNLPEIPTFNSTTTITVDTKVKPSEFRVSYVKTK